jgi:hypothetical protein
MTGRKKDCHPVMVLYGTPLFIYGIPLFPLFPGTAILIPISDLIK